MAAELRYLRNVVLVVLGVALFCGLGFGIANAHQNPLPFMAALLLLGTVAVVGFGLFAENGLKAMVRAAMPAHERTRARFGPLAVAVLVTVNGVMLLIDHIHDVAAGKPHAVELLAASAVTSIWVAAYLTHDAWTRFRPARAKPALHARREL